MVVRTIRPHIWGSEIVSFTYFSEGRVPNVYASQLTGQTFHQVGRLGKYIIFKLDTGYIISHLRMTGQWLYQDKFPVEEQHFRWGLTVCDKDDNLGYLWFRDARKFGTLDWTPSLADYEPFSRLGPDGLTLNEMKSIYNVIARAKKSSRPIKNFLLDQSVIAGVGNIYCSSVLFDTKVSPYTKACNLTTTKITEICYRLYSIFQEAIAMGGSSISDYTGGSYHETLKVYGRDGEPCYDCGTIIKRIVQAGRSTFYCPVCQNVEEKDYV